MRVLLVLVVVLLIAFVLLRGERDSPEREAGAVHTSPSASHAGPRAPRSPEAGPDGPARTAVASMGSPEDVEDTTPLRVRVVDASARTLDEARARLEFVGELESWLRQRPDGSLVYEAPIRPGSELVLEAPSGWALEEERVVLDEIPHEELLFLATPRPAGIVHGLLVDERDGRPLPFFPFALDGLSDGLPGEVLATDGDGRFVSKDAYSAGRIQFLFDDWRYEAVGWDPSDGFELVVPARVGPRVFVRLDPPLEYLSGAGWSPETGGGVLPLVLEWISLRVEPVPQIVFPAACPARVGEGEVLVWTADPPRLGRARIAPGAGTLGDPVVIEMKPCAILGYSLPLWPHDAEGLVLVCTDREGSEARVPLGRNRMTASAFALLQGGRVQLEIRMGETVLGAVEAEVTVGEATMVELSLTMPPTPDRREQVLEGLYGLHGSVTTLGDRAVHSEVRLIRVSDGEETLADVEWVYAEGEWTGAFEVRAPAGEHRVLLECRPAYSWSGPRSVTVPHPGALDFVIDASAALVDVFVEPVDEAGGRLRSVDVDLCLDRYTHLDGGEYVDPSAPVLREHPRSVPFEWLCWVPGRQAASGRFDPDERDGDVHVPVRLPRGWGTRLYVGDQHCYGLAGVRVYADGVPVGVTGESGWLGLGLAQRPQRLAFEYGDWVLDPDENSDVRPDGTFEDEHGWLNVYLAPPAGR